MGYDYAYNDNSQLSVKIYSFFGRLNLLIKVILNKASLDASCGLGVVIQHANTARRSTVLVRVSQVVVV